VPKTSLADFNGVVVAGERRGDGFDGSIGRRRRREVTTLDEAKKRKRKSICYIAQP
jgi:hypothetical protein